MTDLMMDGCGDGGHSHTYILMDNREHIDRAIF